jgi:hypothetical protein
MSRFRTLWSSLALTLALMAFTSTTMAQQGQQGQQGNGRGAPEIDPSSIGSALALLGFGATMLLDRRRRR